MYSYRCLCILIVVYVFLDAATLTEIFPCFFLGCKANARVILAKTGHGPHSSKIVVCIVVLYYSMYCLCVNVYCHRVTTQLQLTNIPYHIISYCGNSLHVSASIEAGKKENWRHSGIYIIYYAGCLVNYVTIFWE